MPKKSIARYRGTVQGAMLILFLLLPVMTLNGLPFLRMDLGRRTLFLAGAAIRIDQFFLVLLLTLAIVAGFLFLTAALGRVWCGWLCPQTILNDLLDRLRHSLAGMRPPAAAVLAVHLCALLLSAAVSFGLLCWFAAPSDLARSLAAPLHNPLIAALFYLMVLLLYLDLVLVRRQFCSGYCPYGRFQAALMDDTTLNLAFVEETRTNCLRCGACVRACPMGIDVRQGFQIECINCGRCIDACRGVMEKRGGDGLIAYRFGTLAGSGLRVGRKTLLLGALTLLLAGGVTAGLMTRSDAAFSAQRVATAEARDLPDGSHVQAWRVVVGNHTDADARYSLDIVAPAGQQAVLLGPVVDFAVPSNGSQAISFFIRFASRPPAGTAFSLRLLQGGNRQALIRITP